MTCDDLSKKCKAGDKKACELYKEKCGKVIVSRYYQKGIILKLEGGLLFAFFLKSGMHYFGCLLGHAWF